MSSYISFEKAKEQSPHWIQIVQEEAATLGKPLCRCVAGHVLWNLTAYPFATEAEVREQVREAFRKLETTG